MRAGRGARQRLSGLVVWEFGGGVKGWREGDAMGGYMVSYVYADLDLLSNM